MKLFFSLLITIILFNTIKLQAQPPSLDTSVFALPNNYNDFIKSPDVSYASIYAPFSSKNLCSQNKTTGFNVYDCLSRKIESGDFKSYLTTFQTLGYYTGYKNLFLEVDKNYYYKRWKLPLRRDSLKNIIIDQYLYIKNHSFKSYILAIAPVYYCDSIREPYYADLSQTAFNTVLITRSYCALNKKPDFKPKNTDKLIALDSVSFILDRSPESFANIKTTYGMDIMTSLWFDLSKGYNKVIDLDSNKAILPRNVWNYSIPDSISVPVYDSLGNILRHYKLANSPILARSLFTFIEIYEKWYYDETQNIFLSKPEMAIIYTRQYPYPIASNDTKAKFKIIFK